MKQKIFKIILKKLSEKSMIKQIDIENESSAFIEILVGNLNDMDEDFEVLLPATSFMSPSESKSLINTNRLKIFTCETDLDENLAEKKWEVIKIICTQPFNTVKFVLFILTECSLKVFFKSLQFGISSIKFYDDIINDTCREAVSKKLSKNNFLLFKYLGKN